MTKLSIFRQQNVLSITYRSRKEKSQKIVWERARQLMEQARLYCYERIRDAEILSSLREFCMEYWALFLLMNIVECSAPQMVSIQNCLMYGFSKGQLVVCRR